MRIAFIETLRELACQDERIFLLTADLGWGVVERFAEMFPDRFLNVGVAEQNLVGIATGLAQAGYVPFIYSIANFVTMRCYEQIRNGPVLHQLPVRIVGAGGGFAYGHAGPTHYAFEDLAILRTQPGMTVLAPADPAQTQTVIRTTALMPGPVYCRVGKGNNPEIPRLGGRFQLGRPEIVCPGTDVLFLSTGTITSEAVRAASALRGQGISAAVAVLAHVGHSPSPELCELLAQFGAVVTVEEGYCSGGLGSLVAEAVAVQQLGCALSIQGVKEPCLSGSGRPEYMLRLVGLSAEQLAQVGMALVACPQAA
ncbi:hypothetical protein AYO40_02000 [Planctomycetaceae bacterium SCGC AG-212-D15]|nr:hypothetical protein AYO40_02000 [Planctomycetaceae bacterium SCGC AG-212-D15]